MKSLRKGGVKTNLIRGKSRRPTTPSATDEESVASTASLLSIKSAASGVAKNAKRSLDRIKNAGKRIRKIGVQKQEPETSVSVAPKESQLHVETGPDVTVDRNIDRKPPTVPKGETSHSSLVLESTRNSQNASENNIVDQSMLYEDDNNGKKEKCLCEGCIIQ